VKGNTVSKYTSPRRICKIEITDDTLTGRGGLALFSRYLTKIGIYALLEEQFGHIRRSRKGLAVWKLFKQVLCFFFDGTSRHLSYFDHLKKDEGYAGIIEETPKELATSHAIKRFMKSFSWLCGGIFRKLLRRLFLWRLKIERPDEIVLTLDTMVMDNDEAKRREGVQPTYKKKKGFQPLQMIWRHKIIDAVFRGGKKHSNHGNTAINMITDMVKFIHSEYREDVMIVVRFDSGFFDEKIFTALDELRVAFIGTGKMYKGVKEIVRCEPEESWSEYDNGHQVWSWMEFEYGCDSWKGTCRTIYTRPVYEDRQRLLDFARPDNVILTNIGVHDRVLEHCTPVRRKEWNKPEMIIRYHHQRGADELPHRGLKDFGFEQLPFKRFAPNCAFYYCMLIGFFLFETFKEDVLRDVVPVTAYATTVRRMAVDFAAKIVRRGHQIILKVTRAVMEAMQIDTLWSLCQHPPPIHA